MSQRLRQESIEILERIGFDAAGEPNSWTRSLDGGKTWTRVEWPEGERLPFVFLRMGDKPVEFVDQRYHIRK